MHNRKPTAVSPLLQTSLILCFGPSVSENLHTPYPPAELSQVGYAATVESQYCLSRPSSFHTCDTQAVLERIWTALLVVGETLEFSCSKDAINGYINDS